MALTVLELRMYLGERIPSNGSASDTLFTDEELGLILDRGAGRFYLTMGHAWNAKAGILSELIDIAEDGSTRNLSKRFDQANRQAQNYYKLALQEDENVASEIPPVVGRGFDAFKRDIGAGDGYVFHHSSVQWP